MYLSEKENEFVGGNNEVRNTDRVAYLPSHYTNYCFSFDLLEMRFCGILMFSNISSKFVLVFLQLSADTFLRLQRKVF